MRNQPTSHRKQPFLIVWIVLATVLFGMEIGIFAQTNGSAPVITIQPLSRTASVGDNLMFNVGASGTAPLAYQWQLNSTNLPNATNASLILVNLTTNQAGLYTAVVTNSSGSITSSPANLTIQPFVPEWAFYPLHSFLGAPTAVLQPDWRKDLMATFMA